MKNENLESTEMHRALTETYDLVARIETESEEIDLGGREADQDGSCRLEISPDKMTVTADFFPSVGHGRPLSSDRFGEILRERSVSRF